MVFPSRMSDPGLPIESVLHELRRELGRHDAVVLQAPPGSGKTTRVPLALLEESWLAGHSILMLEPRRLAAGNAARFMAGQLGEQVGKRVGYTIRYERKVSADTRIEVVTEGVLTRRLQRDPELAGVGLVIFDEFHERHLQTDLALALCRDVQEGLRDNLKLLVMSATLDATPLVDRLGGAPLLQCEGRMHPVETEYVGGEFGGRDVAAMMARRIAQVAGRTAGDILVFLPGTAEILRCRNMLQGHPDLNGIEVVPLYGGLDYPAQERAIRPAQRRKVVLATNIAESSLTIQGVRVVIDSGLVRQPRFDVGSGLTRLETVRVSRASAQQRAGRAGRLGPGHCFRLWTAGEHGALLPFAPPEIRSSDLAPLALDLAAWGVPEGTGLSWLDPPPEGALASARELLVDLDALDARGALTRVGRRMIDFPAHPRVARLLIEAERLGLSALGCDLAALFGEPGLLRGKGGRAADLRDVLQGLRFVGNGQEISGPFRRGRRFWRQRMQVRSDNESASGLDIGRLVAVGWPDRIALEAPPGSGRYRLANGSGAGLAPAGCHHSPALVAVSTTGRSGADGRIGVFCPFDPEMIHEIFPERIRTERRVGWDEGAGRVTAAEETRFGALVLGSRQIPVQASDRVDAFLALLRRRGLELLTWDKEAGQLLARCRFVARYGSDDWPDYSSEALLGELENWLAPYLLTCSREADLAKVDLCSALRARLNWSQLQQLDRLAPERWQVPSGSKVRIDYRQHEQPVLAVKLQELFGLAETPSIGGGSVPLLLDLLSPARRPIQRTQDLKNFWNEVYPEVKKELKGRYPKHPWPDDPWSAEPTRRTRRKK